MQTKADLIETTGTACHICSKMSVVSCLFYIKFLFLKRMCLLIWKYFFGLLLFQQGQVNPYLICHSVYSLSVNSKRDCIDLLGDGYLSCLIMGRDRAVKRQLCLL